MIEREIREFLLSKGVADVGFSEVHDADTGGLKYAISIVVRLSDAIVDEIDGAPTATYFNHYRTVNAFIDRCLLETGMLLQSMGYKYITVAASQSMPGTPFNGRYSHKKAACLAGLGNIGKNSLFLHRRYGARVRLGTLFTDCPLKGEGVMAENPCKNCDLCVKACPAGAILGPMYHEGITREEMFGAALCSEHMKKAYQKIGRGAVCGICMKVCPVGKK